MKEKRTKGTMNILIADDEENILTLISAILSKEGFTVFCARDGEEALNVYYDKHIDMLVLDEMMPKLSGNDLIKEIRKENADIPIIMATAKYLTADKAASFSYGADDYMVKPIDGDELIMRIKALFRRAKINTDKKITVGAVTLDSNTYTISDGCKRQLTLNKTEFEILYKLLSYPEKAFTKWQIYNEFWGVNSDTDEGIVKVVIFKIRKQIELFPEIGIKTVMGVGYQGVRNEK